MRMTVQQLCASSSSQQDGSRNENSADNHAEEADGYQEAAPITVGFLGCGVIAEAIATGLALKQQASPVVQHIYVTRRSEQRSRRLAETFPGLVTVLEDHQSIVDRANVIFCCVLPEQTAGVLQGVEFDTNKLLVSLVSTSTLENLSRDSRLPTDRVFKMICLPSVAQCDGVCLLLTVAPADTNEIVEEGQGDNDDAMAYHNNKQLIVSLCQSLGGCVEASSPEQMSALMVTTGMMGPFYGVLRNQYQFLTSQGIDPAGATQLIGRLHHCMIQDVTRRLSEASLLFEQPEQQLFDELVAEQTPGGLNEQALANLEQLGVMDSYSQAQEALLSRIRGESDGSLSSS